MNPYCLKATETNRRRRVELKCLLNGVRPVGHHAEPRNVTQYLVSEGMTSEVEVYEKAGRGLNRQVIKVCIPYGVMVLVVSVIGALFLSIEATYMSPAFIPLLALIVALFALLITVFWNVSSANFREKWEILSEFAPSEPVLKGLCGCCQEDGTEIFTLREETGDQSQAQLGIVIPVEESMKSPLLVSSAQQGVENS